MIRRLRMKFVLMNMVFVTLLLAAVFTVVIQTTRASLVRDTMRAMEQAAMGPLGPGRPGRRESVTPCFTLRLGPHGELIAAGDGSYDLSDEAWLWELLQKPCLRGRRTACCRTTTSASAGPVPRTGRRWYSPARPERSGLWKR